MERFAMRVLACEPDLDGFVGVLVAGPVSTAGDLRVGDHLLVTMLDGQEAAGRVTAFPLVRWVEDRRDWCTVMVSGVSAESIALGHNATAGGPSQGVRNP